VVHPPLFQRRPEEGALAKEDGPRGTPPRVEVVRRVRVDLRVFQYAAIRDHHSGPPRGSRQVEARAGRRGTTYVLRSMPGYEVAGEPAPEVAGRHQLDCRGVFRAGRPDARRRRQDVVKGGHQRRARVGIIHEAKVRTVLV